MTPLLHKPYLVFNSDQTGRTKTPQNLTSWFMNDPPKMAAVATTFSRGDLQGSTGPLDKRRQGVCQELTTHTYDSSTYLHLFVRHKYIAAAHTHSMEFPYSLLQRYTTRSGLCVPVRFEVCRYPIIFYALNTYTKWQHKRSLRVSNFHV